MDTSQVSVQVLASEGGCTHGQPAYVALQHNEKRIWEAPKDPFQAQKNRARTPLHALRSSGIVRSDGGLCGRHCVASAGRRPRHDVGHDGRLHRGVSAAGQGHRSQASGSGSPCRFAGSRRAAWTIRRWTRPRRGRKCGRLAGGSFLDDVPHHGFRRNRKPWRARNLGRGADVVQDVAGSLPPSLPSNLDLGSSRTTQSFPDAPGATSPESARPSRRRRRRRSWLSAGR